MTLREIFTSTAEAIRAKTGKIDLIKPINFADEIASIEGDGTDTSDATATSADILIGTTAYTKDGLTSGTMPNNGAINVSIDGIDTKSVIIAEGYTSGGTINLDDTISTEVGEQSDLIAQIREKVNSLPEAGGSSEMEDKLIEGTITEYINPRVSQIGSGVFAFGGLINASFPMCTSIGSSAFDRCSKLTTISFSACETIGASAFQYCSSLTNISFPACTNIGSSAFQYCRDLTNINFPACTSISERAFLYCSNLTSVSFPACTRICSYAFEHCSNLTNISFPACTSISAYAFANCSNLIYADFPRCSFIEEAFYSCRTLTTISLPVCVEISGQAFRVATSLTTVDFPACCRLSGAFWGCANLTMIALGNASIAGGYGNVYFGSSTFYGCSKLMTLKLRYGGGGCARLSNVNAFTGTPMSNSSYTGAWGSIYVPASLVDAYKSATNWVTYADRITALTDET